MLDRDEERNERWQKLLPDDKRDVLRLAFVANRSDIDISWEEVIPVLGRFGYRGYEQFGTKKVRKDLESYEKMGLRIKTIYRLFRRLEGKPAEEFARDVMEAAGQKGRLPVRQ